MNQFLRLLGVSLFLITFLINCNLFQSKTEPEPEEVTNDIPVVNIETKEGKEERI